MWWFPLMQACSGSTPPVIPPPVGPTPPAPLYDCPVADPPFSTQLGAEPRFAEPPTATLTRTYTGRISLPLDASLGFDDVYLLGSPIVIVSSESDAEDTWATFEAVATCTTCDHADLRFGGPDSDLILTTKTNATGDPVVANFSLQTTAWMILGMSSDEGAALAAPVDYGDRPDLNPYINDMLVPLLDSITLLGMTGIDAHGRPLPGSEAFLAVDELLADPSIPAPPAHPLPWLFPQPQLQPDDVLVVWGEQGRSDPLFAQDARFLPELPLTEAPRTYAMRYLGPEGRLSPVSVVTTPPDRPLGALELTTVFTDDGPVLESVGPPETWTVIRPANAPPVLCRSNSEGRVRFPMVQAPRAELAAIEPDTLEVVAHTTCAIAGAVVCD